MLSYPAAIPVSGSPSAARSRRRAAALFLAYAGRHGHMRAFSECVRFRVMIASVGVLAADDAGCQPVPCERACALRASVVAV